MTRGSLTIYYVFLFLNMALAPPENHISTGVHQVFVFCNGGPIPASFSSLFYFWTENFSSPQDSNSDCQSRRWGHWPLSHHHGPYQVFDLKGPISRKGYSKDPESIGDNLIFWSSRFYRFWVLVTSETLTWPVTSVKFTSARRPRMKTSAWWVTRWSI